MRRLLAFLFAVTLAQAAPPNATAPIHIDTKTHRVVEGVLDFTNTTVLGIAGVGGSTGVASVNGVTGAVTITKATVGLGSVDDTSDLAKPVSTATQTALSSKASIAPSLTQFAGGAYAYRDLKNLFLGEVNTRLSGQTPGSTSQNLFSTRNDGSNTYARSALWFGHDLDLTCVSVYNDSGNPLQTATLISPRHVLMAHHYFPANGTHFRFVNAGGSVVTRTLSNSLQVGATDIQIGLLDSDVPGTITFAKVFGSIAAENKSVGSPTIYTNQNQKASIADVTSVAAGFIAAVQSSDATRSGFWTAPISGDSSHPGFVISDGQLILLGSFYTNFQFVSIAQNYAGINSAMATLGTSYQLTPSSVLALLDLTVPFKAGNDSGANLSGLVDLSASSSARGGSINSKGGTASGATGGSIAMNGGSGASATAGSITTSGGTGGSANGGSISTASSSSGHGGAISTGTAGAGNGGAIHTEGATANGGSISTAAYSAYAGGNVDTYAGPSAAGGAINTSQGGGSIDTNSGFIDLGLSGARAHLYSAGNADRDLQLPDRDGVIATNGDISDSISALALGDSASLDVGTNAGTVAAGDHIHTGVTTASVSGSVTPTNSGKTKTAYDWTVTGNITGVASPGGSPSTGDTLELNVLLSGGAWTIGGWNAIYALGDNPPTIPTTSGKAFTMLFEYSALKTKWLLRAVSDTY